MSGRPPAPSVAPSPARGVVSPRSQGPPPAPSAALSPRALAGGAGEFRERAATITTPPTSLPLHSLANDEASRSSSYSSLVDRRRQSAAGGAVLSSSVSTPHGLNQRLSA